MQILRRIGLSGRLCLDYNILFAWMPLMDAFLARLRQILTGPLEDDARHNMYEVFMISL